MPQADITIISSSAIPHLFNLSTNIGKYVGMACHFLVTSDIIIATLSPFCTTVEISPTPIGLS